MLLAELRGRRPKRAGKARIEYVSMEALHSSYSYPFRKDDVIVLPDRGDLELYRLQPNWNQFIARFDFSTVWFGGTDENPFLVRIDDIPFSQGYCVAGPRGFYRNLVPELPGKTYRRQGDIFATPIPFTWEEILKAYSFLHGLDVEVLESEVEEGLGGLFGTRHHLKGLTLNHTVQIPGGFTPAFGSGPPWLVLAEGRVVAPDHTDMKLEGVHALAQTVHLTEPRTAD